MDSLTELFYLTDDFCRQFEPALERHLLEAGVKKRKRCSKLSLSELMTLAILFHQLRFRQFKSFYLIYSCCHLQAEFPKLPSYTHDTWKSRAAVELATLESPGVIQGLAMVGVKPNVLHNRLPTKRSVVGSPC